MTRPGWLGSIVMVSLLWWCSVAVGAEPVRPGTMTVTGSATLEVSPDCFDLTMEVNAEAAAPGLAVRAVQVKQAAVLGALTRVGVGGPDVRLSQLTLAPVYEQQGSGVPPRVRGYRAEIVVTATSRKLDKIGELMDVGASAGVVQMSSAFRRSNLPELKARVRDLAIAAARAKAKQLADGAGARLGRVVSIAEGSPAPSWYGGATTNAIEVRSNGVAAVDGALQSLSLDVTIGYELAP